MNYTALRAELTSDPLAWGYAAMSDAQAAARLNATDTGRTLPRRDVRPTEVFGAIRWADWPNPATDAKKDSVLRAILSMPQIDMGDNSVRNLVRNTVPSGSNGETALLALATRPVSRAEELALGAVTEGDVALARGGVW